MAVFESGRGWVTPDGEALWATPLESLRPPDWGSLREGLLTATEPAVGGKPVPPSVPTPRAQDEYERRNMKTMERIRDEGGDMTLPTWAKVVLPLLPTPRAQDGPKGGPGQVNGRGKPDSLPAISALLPTPATANSKSTRAMTASTKNGRRSGGGQSSPPGLEETAAIVSGYWPEHMPPVEDLPPATMALLPTPTSQAAKHGETPDRGANAFGHNLWDLPHLLPTPRAAADRASRASLTREGHWSAPSLEQAVEFAQGVLPREYESWDEVQGRHAQYAPGEPSEDPDPKG